MNLLHRCDKFVTVQINFRNPTVNFNACCYSRKKIACCSSELITTLYSGSSIQNASEQFVSSIQLNFLTAFFIQPLKRNCNRVRSEDLKNSVTIPNQKMFIRTFLPRITDTITSQNIDLSSRITPVYNGRYVNPFHINIYGRFCIFTNRLEKTAEGLCTFTCKCASIICGFEGI
jgi:hypothetical protein